MEVKESRERVQVAIRNSGITIKPSKIAVNISPANVRKQGTGFDLPIAVGILAATAMIPTEHLNEIFMMGELSLSGKINGVRGILPALCEAGKRGIKTCIIPWDNRQEVCRVDGMTIYLAKTLSQVIAFLRHSGSLEKSDFCMPDTITKEVLDYSSIRGQEAAKRATMVAAAGMHNLLYVGSPGCGKTMMAQRIPSIMPSMTFEEQMEISKIYSISGLLAEHGGWINTRPFRNPHHTVTASALMGGGLVPAAGEITLAHGGVLFLDELTEFSMKTLEHLRQPLEDRTVNISRVHGAYTFPANFMLVASMNPCKCGYYPDRNRCRCTEHDRERYIGRISKPMWDRFDIVVKAEEVTIEEIMEKERKGPAVKAACHKEIKPWNSASMKQGVEQALQIQKNRFKNRKFAFNAIMTTDEIEKFCTLGAAEKELLNEIYHKLSLTVRGYYKVLKVARTIADIEGKEKIDTSHIAEAISYRCDRMTGGI